MYRVEFKRKAVDDMRRLDQPVAQRALRRIKWLSENFDAVTPEQLTAEFKGFFKLRIGSYRVIYEVRRKEQLIIIHLIGHRSTIYKKK